MAIFKQGFKHKRRPAWEKRMAAALDAIEQDLGALEDIIEILNMVPPENPPPVYLCQRVEAHVAALRLRFEEAWAAMAGERDQSAGGFKAL